MRAWTIVVRAFVVAVVVVPNLDFVCKFLAPALPPYPRTSSGSYALHRLNDAIRDDRSILALAQSRWWHKVVVARVLKQHPHDVFLFLVVFICHA
ncbi:hypothetical protein H4582DRAFT_1959795 [Lactarius indigo]|nr:hypothetical protein H4582DRAFT_1959795 [Lactarius indigo]